jgi:branched-chain amino acid aminotransferase
MKVWIDGAVVEGSQARIPVTDHGFLYGDGVFEGIRLYNRRIFRFDDHLSRLASGARCLGLTIPGGVEAVRRIVIDTARVHARDDAYLRLIVSRGEGPLGIDPTRCVNPRIVCIADQVSLYPEEKIRAGIALVTSSLRKPAPDVLDPRVKSLNYLNSALAKQEARRQCADEALLLNAAGQVVEASVANVFAVRSGRLLTPPASDGALEGLTRDTVLDLAREQRVPTEERTLGRFDLLAAEEVFLTGTGARIVAVGSLDGIGIGKGGPGPITRRLCQAFEQCARSTGTPISM